MKPTKRPFLTRTLTCVLIAAGSLHVSLSSHAESISPEEAHAIGVEAYLYFYSLVTMDITRKQLTNVERAEGISAPMNTFANIPAYPTADMKVVVRPNFDTLYSSGWLDLTKEPVVAPYRTPAGVIICSRCSICGRTCSRPRAGAPLERRPPTFLSRRQVGRARCPTACNRSRHLHLTYGLSAAPRPTARPTTMPFTKSKPATRSRRSPLGENRRGRNRQG